MSAEMESANHIVTAGCGIHLHCSIMQSASSVLRRGGSHTTGGCNPCGHESRVVRGGEGAYREYDVEEFVIGLHEDG